MAVDVRRTRRALREIGRGHSLARDQQTPRVVKIVAPPENIGAFVRLTATTVGSIVQQ
jgi:hypothetical protein